MNTTFNTLSLAVKAAFEITLDGQRVKDALKEMAVPVPYEFGLFAEQDVRVCVSTYYALIYQLVGLMPVPVDRPLQDLPKEGSLEANDTGHDDEQALAREAAIADCLRGIGVLSRHLESLHSKARKDTEEAGMRRFDGGRLRFNFKGQQFRPYAKSFDDVLLDMRAQTPVSDTRRLAQISMAEEYILPQVAETDAVVEFMDYMDPEKLTANSQKAVDAIIELLIDIGDLLTRHEVRMAELNAERNEAANIRDHESRKFAVDSVMSRMAVERNQYRLDVNRPLWLLKQRLSAVAFLRHSGGFSGLVNSSEWRTAEALERAKVARAMAAEAQATAVELEASIVEGEANMALFKARQQQLAMKQALEAQTKAFEALITPPKAKAEPEAETEVELVKAPKAPKAEAKPMVHLSTLAGAANGFRPRG